MASRYLASTMKRTPLFTWARSSMSTTTTINPSPNHLIPPQIVPRPIVPPAEQRYAHMIAAQRSKLATGHITAEEGFTIRSYMIPESEEAPMGRLAKTALVAVFLVIGYKIVVYPQRTHQEYMDSITSPDDRLKKLIAQKKLEQANL